MGLLLYAQGLNGEVVDSSRQQPAHVRHPKEIVHYVLHNKSAFTYLNYFFVQVIYCYSQAVNIQTSRTMINKIYNSMTFENSWHFEPSLYA